MENNTTDKNIFETLKEIRIQKGILLEKISEKSKIQLKYLHALEEGDLLKIPEVYDKLFFRSYLKALDVEEEEYLEIFLKYRQNVRIDKTTTMIEFSSPSKETKKEIFSHRNLFVILPSALIALVITFLLLNTEIVRTSSKGKVQEIDIKNVVERLEAKEQAKRDSIQARLDSIKINEQIASRLSLEINAIKKTWFRVVSDKSDTSEYLITPGQDVNVLASKTFEFLIGRADGLHMELNGENLNVTETDSNVVRYMLIDSSGIVVKRLKRD